MSQDKTVNFRLRLSAYDLDSMKEATDKLNSLDFAKEAFMKGPLPLPTKTRRWCLLKSPHVYKKSREHFECRVYKRMVDLYVELPNVDKYGKIIGDLKLPPGVRVEL